MKLTFHIQHNTTPMVVRQMVSAGAGETFSAETFYRYSGVNEDSFRKRIGPFVRQLLILNGWQLGVYGQRITELHNSYPDLLTEALHLQLYTLYWCRQNAYFSFAYSAICDWLWDRGERALDGRASDELVGAVVNRAQDAYGVDADAIAFSKNSVAGAKHWLRALDPPVVEGDTFRRRLACPPQTLLWAVDALYRKENRDYGVRMELQEEQFALLCKACLLEPDSLEVALQTANQAHDWRRPGGFFGIGTEGGFGRWMMLTKPIPVGCPEPIEMNSKEE